jgi:hypothetical protein
VEVVLRLPAAILARIGQHAVAASATARRKLAI